MTLRAITFDFWNTLIDGAPMPERSAQRVARIHEVLSGAGHALTQEELRAAMRASNRRISAEMKVTLQEIGPPMRWATLAAELGVPHDLIPYEVVERAYEELTLGTPPAALHGVTGAVRALRDDGYRLGVICNTGMQGGTMLRRVLAHYDLLECFATTTWSDEFGWSKPDPRIFAHTLEALGVEPGEVLHVGDMEDLDVLGANGAGWHSALYAPDSGEVTTQADLRVRNWEDFPRLIADYRG